MHKYFLLHSLSYVSFVLSLYKEFSHLRVFSHPSIPISVFLYFIYLDIQPACLSPSFFQFFLITFHLFSFNSILYPLSISYISLDFLYIFLLATFFISSFTSFFMLLISLFLVPSCLIFGFLGQKTDSNSKMARDQVDNML